MALTDQQCSFFHDHGYLHVPAVFAGEVEELSSDLDALMDTWAERTKGWTGAWRGAYMDAETERRSELVALHDLQLYSAAWARAVVHRPLVETLAQLLQSPVELHHTTMHVKPPETGHPFPMHQDYPFYPHTTGAYIDVLVHLDDTCHENGEIRFLDGSHKLGPLEHIVADDHGTRTSPFLPVEQYRLEDTVPVPARRGDVVLFSILTVHGSYINTTDRYRRLVRMGYRSASNRQLSGQSFGRPGLMVQGLRARRPDDKPFPQSLFQTPTT